MRIERVGDALLLLNAVVVGEKAKEIRQFFWICSTNGRGGETGSATPLD